MTSDSSQPASSGPEKLKMPDESHAGDSKGDSAGGSRSGASVDTVLGRLVVEQGLATHNEVDDCLKSKTPEDSLASLLVKGSFVTPSQLERLKRVVEAERSGQQIPGFRILGKLGAGAMATVFKGKQLSLDRTVAIKVLPRKFSSNAEFIERFYAEGRAAAQLNHPNIVQAYDVGKAGEFHYFVMEFVEGSTVYEQIVRAKRYSEADAINIAIQMAEALEHAHSKGLIHRDVKPKNIMLTRSGIAKLADMGLARGISDKEAAEQEAGKAYGTPYYISPEQIRGERVLTPAADIYSLGATLYHMVTGNVPFDGKNPSDVMHKHLKTALIPPDHVNPKLSAGISQIIEMMMAKDPRERYTSCADVLTDLRSVRAGDRPIFARSEVVAADLSTLAAEAESASITEIPIDRFRTPSPWSHPLAQVFVYLLIVSVIANAVLLILYLS